MEGKRKKRRNEDSSAMKELLVTCKHPSLKRETHQCGKTAILQATPLENSDAGAAQAETGAGVPAPPSVRSQHFRFSGFPSVDCRYPGRSIHLNPLFLKQTEFLLWWGTLDPGLGSECFGASPHSGCISERSSLASLSLRFSIYEVESTI